MSILAALEIPESQAFQSINVSRAAVNRMARRGQPLAVAEAERVLGVAKLIGQVHQLVEESGEAAEFSAAAWLSNWLLQPLPAFGGALPIGHDRRPSADLKLAEADSGGGARLARGGHAR